MNIEKEVSGLDEVSANASTHTRSVEKGNDKKDMVFTFALEVVVTVRSVDRQATNAISKKARQDVVAARKRLARRRLTRIHV